MRYGLIQWLPTSIGGEGGRGGGKESSETRAWCVCVCVCRLLLLVYLKGSMGLSIHVIILTRAQLMIFFPHCRTQKDR